MKDSFIVLKLYSPLTADFLPDDPAYGYAPYEDDDSVCYDDDPIEYDGQDLLEYQAAIEQAMQRYGYCDENGVDLFPYKDDRVCEKVRSLHVIVEVKDGELMGCTTVRLEQTLTPDECWHLQSYVAGQFSDGWGEGFEQQDIRIEDGCLNVHFWQSEGFSFKREYPRPDRAAEVPTAEQPRQRPRPRMNLVGMDGNIFAILGRAGAVLREAGLGDQVKEMSDRVYASGSYYTALKIISEYVETELSPPQPKPPRPNRGDAR